MSERYIDVNCSNFSRASKPKLFFSFGNTGLNISSPFYAVKIQRANGAKNVGSDLKDLELCSHVSLENA